MAPLKPRSLTVRSSSSAAASGTAVGSAGEGGEALRIRSDDAACRRSLTRRVSAAAVSAGSFCVDGAPCEITCMSMPASSISLMRTPAEIVEPLVLLARPAGFAAGIGFRQLLVPVMLFDGDDRTMRFREHYAPYLVIALVGR